MYWLVADETNVDPAHGTFLIYGGLIFRVEQMVAAHELVVGIPPKYGYLPTDSFKFNTHARPIHVSREDSKASKAQALEGLRDLGVRMIVYVIHHSIAAGQDTQTRMEFAINAVATNFDKKFLARHNDHGVLCIDRVEGQDGYGFLRKRFQEPIKLPDGRTTELTRNVHYSMSADGASHISSLVDISLGAFRYAVNTAMGQGRAAVAKSMFPTVAQLLWRQKHGDREYVGGLGFLPYPKTVKAPVYAADYDQLGKTLGDYAMDAEGPDETSQPGAAG